MEICGTSCIVRTRIVWDHAGMNVRTLYSAVSRVYDAGSVLNGHVAEANFIVKRLPFAPDAPITILDAGCGTGVYSMTLLKRFPNARLVAFDLNEDMLLELKNKLIRSGDVGRVTMFPCDINALPKDLGGPFDLILTGGVLEYVDTDRAVGPLLSHLKSGGYFMNSTVRNTVCGQILGKLAVFRPRARQENLDFFLRRGMQLVKIDVLPASYLYINQIKEGHLFRKP